jgi:hypothetical protein
MGMLEVSVGGVLSFFFFLSFCAAAGDAQVRKSAAARSNSSVVWKMRAAGQTAKYFFIRVRLLWQKRIARRFEPGGVVLSWFTLPGKRRAD